MRWTIAFLSLCLLVALEPATGFAQSQAAILDALAAAVRQRGETCGKPLSAEEDKERSEPDRKAWVLRCDNATYRVKFMGDTGAEVVRLD